MTQPTCNLLNSFKLTTSNFVRLSYHALLLSMYDVVLKIDIFQIKHSISLLLNRYEMEFMIHCADGKFDMIEMTSHWNELPMGLTSI